MIDPETISHGGTLNLGETDAIGNAEHVYFRRRKWKGSYGHDVRRDSRRLIVRLCPDEGDALEANLRRLEAVAHKDGAGELAVIYLFSAVSTAGAVAKIPDPIGPMSDQILSAALEWVNAEPLPAVLCSFGRPPWSEGTGPSALAARRALAAQVLKLVSKAKALDIGVYCGGKLAGAWPIDYLADGHGWSRMPLDKRNIEVHRTLVSG